MTRIECPCCEALNAILSVFCFRCGTYMLGIRNPHKFVTAAEADR